MHQRRLVWDLPTRIFHWSLVGSFFIAYLTADSERWALLHITAGYSCLGLIIFRLIWGFAGSRYVQFREFLPKPIILLQYLAHYLSLQKPATHYIGHNPLGGMAVVLILLTGLICSLSGYLCYADLDEAWLEQLHDSSADVWLGLVVIHVLGVGLSSYLHQENLLRAMLDGKKSVAEHDAISKQYVWLAILMVVSLCAWWLWSFNEVIG